MPSKQVLQRGNLALVLSDTAHKATADAISMNPARATHNPRTDVDARRYALMCAATHPDGDCPTDILDAYNVNRLYYTRLCMFARSGNFGK